MNARQGVILKAYRRKEKRVIKPVDMHDSNSFLPWAFTHGQGKCKCPGGRKIVKMFRNLKYIYVLL